MTRKIIATVLVVGALTFTAGAASAEPQAGHGSTSQVDSGSHAR